MDFLPSKEKILKDLEREKQQRQLEKEMKNDPAVRSFMEKVRRESYDYSKYSISNASDFYSMGYAAAVVNKTPIDSQTNYKAPRNSKASKIKNALVRIGRFTLKVMEAFDTSYQSESYPREEAIYSGIAPIDAISKSKGKFIYNGRVLTPRIMTVDEEWAEKREAGPLIYEELKAERFATQLEIERDFKSGSISKSEAIYRLSDNERRYNRTVNVYKEEGY